MERTHSSTVESQPTKPPKRRGVAPALLIAILFCVAASAMIIAGRYQGGYRLGQYITEPVHARVNFAYLDRGKFATAQQRARELEPRVYHPNPQFSWAAMEDQIRHWPELVSSRTPADLPEALKASLDSDSLALVAQYQSPERRSLFGQRVETFFAPLRKVVILPAEQHVYLAIGQPLDENASLLRC